ncbi:MAG: metallophosphoesterase, partial [Bacteroidaceae bacterium]|nr:metallophosphoesterase [Bacteroidaceae bacterium]
IEKGTENLGTYAQNIEEGTELRLYAQPVDGYDFVCWSTNSSTSNSISTENPYTTTVNGHINLYACFAESSPETPQYTITVSASPAEGGTATVAVGTGQGAASQTVDSGTTVTLSASPNSGYTFVNWTKGGNVVSTSASFTTDPVTANADYVANFTEEGDNANTVALIASAKELKNKTGVGYPNETERTTLQSAIDAAEANPTASAGTTLQSAIDAYYATANVQMPTAGTTYSFIVGHGNSKYYIYNNNGTLAIASYTEGTTVLPATAKFTCEVSGNYYMFKTSDNKYMAFPSYGAGNYSDASPDGIEDVASDKTKFSIAKLYNNINANVTVSNQDLFGNVYLTVLLRGHKNEGGAAESGVFVVKTTEGIWDGAGSPYDNGTFSSAISIIEVEAESTPETPQYTITVSPEPAEGGTATVAVGTGQASSSLTVDAGTNVTITATPADGYEFVNWTNGGSILSTNTTETYPINADNITLTANFRQTEQGGGEEEEIEYCTPSGVYYNANYITSATTSGANTNISYSATSHPGSTYKIVDDVIKVNPGTSFTLNLVANSLGEGSSSVVREDIRYCHASLFTDFDINGDFGSAVNTWGNNPPTNNVYGNYDQCMSITATIAVPADAKLGRSHIRVIYTNAWNALPTACTTSLDKGIAYDFIVEVVQSYTATVATSPSEGGTAKVNNVQSVTVDSGTEVTFTASPNTGYNFLGWYNGENKVSESLEYTATVTSDLSLTAKFAKQTFTVSATPEGTNGTVTVSPNGTVDYGTQVTFTATANPGYRFVQWSNGETANPYVTTITANTTLTASFELIPTYTVNVTTNGTGGTATASSNSVEENGTVTLTADAADGYRFTGWYQNEELVSTSNPYTIQSVTGNINYVANFVESSNELLLTFACLSDLHAQQDLITDANNIQLRESVTKTLNQIKLEENVDLIVLGGDYTSNNAIPETSWETTRELLVNATRGAFNADKTPVIYVNGNHDYEVANYDNPPREYNAGEYYGTPMKTDIGALAAEDCFYETADNGTGTAFSLLAAYHYVVNGFDFVVLNAGKNLFTSASDYTYSLESVQWCESKLAEIYATDKNKTVFFLVHIPFSDSKSLSSGKGMTSNTATTLLKTTLAKYPNLVMLYGHDHGNDTAYIRTATEQRVTEYATNGDVLTQGESESLYYIQNYNTNKYLGYNSYQITTTDNQSSDVTLIPVEGSSDKYYIYLSNAINDTDSHPINYVNCGSSGRFSGTHWQQPTGYETDTNIQFFEVADPSSSTITATKVTTVESGKTYMLVAYSSKAEGYYALTNEMYSNNSSDQRMKGAAVTITDGTITYAPGTASVLWNIVKKPSATDKSFISSFMGSMRYYGNSIEDGQLADRKIIQALMVYVYSDRVELEMKNYGESGTFNGITINQDLTPYVSYRTVTHSDYAVTAA